MAKTLYFHPFEGKRHYIGIGSHATWTLPSWVSLHGVAPTFARKHFRYLWEIKKKQKVDTFSDYVGAADRIYVMGHGSPGSDALATEAGDYETCLVSELVAIFIKYGLPTQSRAHIRIHACNSASPAIGNDSFAEILKRSMVAKGYRWVTVRGYTLSVGVYFGWRWAEGWGAADNYAVDF